MKAKRVIGLALASTLAFSVVGYAKEEENSKDPVTLEWYYRGNGIQKDTQAVEDRINELLKDYEGLEHVTISLNPFIASDYANAVLLAQTSGEQIDILGSVSLNYVDEVRNESYLQINEYLETEEFADLKETYPEWLWDAVTVDGGIYMVPNYQRAANRGGLRLPAEYAELIDMEELEELLKTGVSTPEDMEKFAAIWEELILAVREKEETEAAYVDKLPALYDYATVANGAYLGGMADSLASGGFIMYAGETEVKNAYLTENFKKACEIQAEWYEKGLVSEDIMVQDYNAYPKLTVTESGFLPMYTCNFAHVGSGAVENTYNDMEVLDLLTYENFFMVNSWGAGGNGVTASCEHPEEALLFLSALNTGTELGTEIYNTLVYGLEDVHYEKIDENHIKTLEYDGGQGPASASYCAHKWIMGNTFNAYRNQAVKDEDVERDLAVNSDPDNVTSPVMGFRLDTTEISSEISQCVAIVDEYKNALYWGVKGEDWEAYYDEFVDKLTAAGYEKVIDEIQAQYDDWASAQ